MSEQDVGASLLSEHEAPGKTSTNPSGYTPSAEEKAAIKLVNQKFEKAKKRRAKYDENWPDYYKMFRGKQWTEQRPSYRHSEVINFIFQSIQSTIPILTDSRPRFDFLPQNPEDMDFAQILSDVAASDWEKGNWLYQLSECLYDAHFYGTAFAGLEFEPKHGSDGDICFKSADPFNFYPDPDALDVNEKCDYVIFAEPTDIAKLKKQYPDKKDFIKPDIGDVSQYDKTSLEQVRYKSPTDNKAFIEGSSSYEAGAKDQVLKVTLWCKSDEFDEEKQTETAEDGSTKEVYVQKLRYPNGRKIVVAGGVLLEDGPNPYEDGLFPYARLVNYILPREFWGMSEVEQLRSPQKIFNKLVSYALDVLVLMGNPVWKVGTGSGVDTDNLINRPGLIVEAEDIDQVQREEGVQLQPFVLQLIDRMQDWFQDLSGRTDVTSGVQPGGVTAASAITSLQEAAQTRLRQKSRNVDAFLKNAGTLYKNRVMQFYSAPKVFRLTDDQNAQKYFKMHIEDVPQADGTTVKKAIVRNYVKAPDGQMKEELEAREFIIKSDFDVKVSTGSSLPFAKSEKAGLAFKMAEAGAIDQMELLKAVDWPNAEAVYQRMENAKAQAQQAEMQAQQQAQAAKQAPPQAQPPAA